MSELTPLGDDDSGLDPDERRLLRAGREGGVPRGAKRAVWAALAAGLPSVAAASTVTTGALTAASLVKYGAIGVLLGTTTMTTVAVVRSTAAPPPAGAARSAATALRDTTLPASRPRAVAPPSGVAPSPPSSASAAAPADSRLVASSASPAPSGTSVAAPDLESRRIAAARGLQRAGRTREALAALEQIAQELPHGELVQEREALAIEALLTLGESAEARRRATAFLARFPNSPHAANARRALE